MKEKELSVFLSTIDSRLKAEEIAENAVRQRLAAGVNIIPHVSSVYRWKGSIEKHVEYLMLFYTRSRLAGPLESFVKETHPYETPALISIDITGGLDSFLEWIAANTVSDVEDV